MTSLENNLYVSNESGIGVKTKQLLEFGYIPSFDQLDDDGKFYLQNRNIHKIIVTYKIGS